MIDDLLATMQRGGPMMWPLLALSLVAVGIAAERLFTLFVTLRLDLDPFVDHLVDLLEGDNYGRALEACGAEAQHPFARVARAGILKANGSERDVERAMEAAALGGVQQMSRGIGLLSPLGNAATLLGLLGTVLGLIEAFGALAEADAVLKQEVLARGIAVAMSTTAFGLVAALVAGLAAAVLQARQARLLAELEAKATELLGHLVGLGQATAQRLG